MVVLNRALAAAGASASHRKENPLPKSSPDL